MLDRDQGRWLTYAEAGQLLGISAEAVRQLARRRGWLRRTPNAYGVQTTVLVPEDAFVRPRTGLDVVHPGDVRGTPELPPYGVVRPGESSVRAYEAADMLRVIRETVDGLAAPLREQLERERGRADRAERRVDELQAALAEERLRIDNLHAELADARTATMIAGSEAAALRAQSDERRDWRLLRRLRWALRASERR